MRTKHWQVYFSELVQGKYKGFLASSLRGVLWILSLPYRSIVRGRNWIYDRQYFKSYVAPVPLVISIGNIVAGGTGKTPVTLMLAQKLSEKATVAILSRGYCSAAEKHPEPLILSRGKGPLYPPSQCGDEPYLLSRNIPQALVIVGPDRFKASIIAAQEGAQILLLDDGMQHRRLARNYEVIVLNANDLFGQGHFLPRGFLRESPKALAKADFIVINHVKNETHFETIKKMLLPYTSSPTVGMQMHVAGVKNAPSGIHGIKVGVFCGIAHPEHFVETVNKLGAESVGHYLLPDHSAMEHHALAVFAEQCRVKGAEFLVCTEKDYVKLEGTLPLPVAWVQTHLKVVAGEEHWNAFLTEMQSAIKT